jgi:putative peptide zinc metalloprotease protein
MSAFLFSASWYRVAKLKPRLRNQANIVRHVDRGERWYVLQDLASGRFLRLNAAAYRVVALMDGHRSLEDIWQNACLTLGDQAPTQDEILQVLSQLHQANVLLTDRKPDLEEISQRRQRIKKLKLKQYLTNPMSIKFPIWDPDRVLARMVGLLPHGVGPWIFGIWAIALLAGIGMAAMHWNELTQDITSRIFTPENMLILWFVFPIVKILHEFGHGLAVKAFGGSCREFGLMFLVLVPVPYVDASQALALPNKWQRMLVSMSGMMVELFLASVAIWLWAWASPGVAKAMLHEIVILAGVTTILFNANPLIRFDGYYVLSDWLEIPNLGQKANQYTGYLIKRHVFGIKDGVTAPHLTPGEARWLLGYAVASFAYRMLIAVGIILMVAGKLFFVGVLLAFWASYTMLILPLLQHVRFLAHDPVLEGHRHRAMAISYGLMAVVMSFALFFPAPSWTNAEGVIWMADESRVRAPLSCFGEAVFVLPGQQVKVGDKLMSCTDPDIEAQYLELRAHAQEIKTRLALANTRDRVQYQIVEAELGHYQKKLRDIVQRREEMTIVSPSNGEFVMSSPEDFPGTFLNRGDVTGYVLDPARFTLIAVVPQGDADLVRNSTQSVELRPVSRVWDMFPARIAREIPAASNELPSLALSLQGGGKIGLDPSVQKGEEPRTLVSMFQFEIHFDQTAASKTLGNRVYVRFVHAPEPLASQWYRSLRQLFMKRFAV